MKFRSWLRGDSPSTTNNTDRPAVGPGNAAVASASATSSAAPATASTPNSSHSTSSPSPSPQPPTPDGLSSFELPARNYFLQSVNASGQSQGSQPINIGAPHNRRSKPSRALPSPARASTFARGAKRHQTVDPDYLEPHFVIESDPDIDNDLDIDLDLDLDADMTMGPGIDSAFGRGRRDSFISTGPKPISMNPNREQHGRNRRGSLANSMMNPGSMMSGLSWGGVSVNSLHDMIMTGTSPFVGAQGASPSVHSSSYIPKLEADYLRNFTCCELILENMHDLLRHYETVHTGLEPSAHLGSLLGTQRMAGSRPPMSSPAMGPGQAGHGFQPQVHFSLAQTARHTSNAVGGLSLGFSGMQMGRQQSGSGGQKQHPLMTNMAQNDDLDSMDMDLDEPAGHLEIDDSEMFMHQTRQQFGGRLSQRQLHLDVSHSGISPRALRPARQSHSGSMSFGFQNNPTVSSVNTPTLTMTQQALNGQGMSRRIDDELSGMSNNMNLSEYSNGYNLIHDAGTFINDPAKRLYSPNGASAQDRAVQQQMAQFGLDQGQFSEVTDPHAKEVLQRAMSTNPSAIAMPPEEDKPFKCPVRGCEKAYKNQNGLKYHKQHGHQTQQLHDNGDGTFSIVNPETSVPYPGEMGMEKEKPHKCEWCSKRYKNLNGLKYHKTHSPACELAAQAAQLRAQFDAAAMGNGANQSGTYGAHGLP